MSTDAPPRVHNPFVGPTSFRLGDPLYGRDRERGDLLDLLVAERIVLFYSPSGAGKTSLIQAALVPSLQEAGFEVLPVIRVTHALEPRPGMPTPRNRYVLGTLLSLEEGVPPARQRPVAELATLTLREYMDAHADRDGQPGNEVLLFDQFEEVLTADPTDEPAKHAFFRELGAMLRDRDHWALFSMREDFLAALDPYLRHVPTRFRSTYRLDLLSVPAALDAMRLPAQRAGVDFTEEAADQLVDDLRRVRVQQPGGGTEEALGSYVEPVQLQVACRLLWSTLPPTSTSITRADVEALGDVDQALAEYYADRVGVIAQETGAREAAIREWFEECLITPQGLRGQVLEGPEASGPAGGAVLDRLVGAHLVRAERRRQATWYELAHDRLIEPVRRDNAAWRASHLSSFERAAALWAEQGRPDRLLLLGPDLAAAEEDAAVRQGALKARERDFLEASRRADERLRRDVQTAATLRRSARRLKRAVALVTLLALATGVLFVQSVGARHRSEEARARAEDQEVLGKLLAGAQRNLTVDRDLAVALTASAAAKYGSDGLPDHARHVVYLAANSPVSLVLRGQQGPTRVAAWSADGSAVVAAGPKDIRMWDRETGEPGERLALQDGDVVNDLAVSSDARTVAAGLEDGTLLVWQVGSRSPARWEEGTGLVWAVALAPDGQRLASVGASNRVQVWDTVGNHQMTLADPESLAANSVAFRPDGSRLATVSDAPRAVLWDAASGLETGRLPLPEAAFRVAFGADAGTLATITTSAVTVWDVAAGLPLHPPFTQSAWMFRNIDADLSRVLTVDSYGSVTAYDLSTGEQVGSSYVPGSSVWGAGFDLDAGRVLVLGDEVDPAYWVLTPTNSYEYAMAATVADDRIISAWSDGALRVWGGEDAGDGLGQAIPGVEARDVYLLEADESGARVAAVTDTGLVRAWDTTTGTELLTLESTPYSYWDVALTSDGEALVTGTAGGRVGLWDTATGRQLEEILGPQAHGIGKVEVSPDGSKVLAAFDPRFTGEAPTAEISDGRTEREPVALVVPLSGARPAVELRLPERGPMLSAGWETPEYVTAGAFSPDGSEVTVGTSEGLVAAFDASSGDHVWSARAHQGQVRDLTVVAHTGDLLTTGDDQQAVLLDPDQRRRIRQVPSESDLLTGVVTADGERLALFSSDGGLDTVPLRDDELVELLRSKVVRGPTPGECDYYRLDPGC